MAEGLLNGFASSSPATASPSHSTAPSADRGETILEIRDVSKAFGDGDALSRVNLSVREGEIVSLLGPSGCGKSTLLRIIAGLDPDHTGSVILDGGEITGPTRDVGVVFQEPRLFPWLNVRRNIGFGLKKADPQRIVALAKAVGLDGYLDSLPRQLSGGMAQRCAIARALVTEPRVLLMDEPFSALDAFTRMRLQEVTLDVWRKVGATLIMVTHDVDEALYLSDRVVIMSERPGTIKAVVPIDLPRPRERASASMHVLKAEIMERLQFGDRNGDRRIDEELRRHP